MKIKVVPCHDELMFIPEDGRIYWKSWWRGYLHIWRLIFQGHDLEVEHRDEK